MSEPEYFSYLWTYELGGLYGHMSFLCLTRLRANENDVLLLSRELNSGRPETRSHLVVSFVRHLPDNVKISWTVH